MIVTRYVRAPQHSVAMGITVSGLTVTVESGSLLVDGETYELSEDYEFMVVTKAVSQIVYGFVVKHRPTGAISVIIDATERGDAPYRWNSSDYEKLHQAWFARVPENTADLSSVEVYVTQITEPGA